MARDFRTSLILRSYGSMYFLSDNISALAALALYGRGFSANLSPGVIRAFVEEVSRHYLDPANGLLATYVNPGAKKIESGARGISIMYSLLFLADASAFCRLSVW